MVVIEKTKLGHLSAGSNTAEVRFVNQDGKTEAWIIRVTERDLESIREHPEGIETAYLDDGVDIRLRRQYDSIDHLLGHVMKHHAELGINSMDDCSYTAAGDGLHKKGTVL